MKITHIETFPAEELLARLKRTPLRGYDSVQIYKDSSLALANAVDPDTLVPAQRYVLQSDISNIEFLYHAFLERSIDIFALEGGVLFWVENTDGIEEGPIPLVPPVVEESFEPGGRTVFLINDGMHRVYAARKLGRRINIVLVRNVPRQYPYYAYALQGGWQGVEELAELPDTYEKKTYRDPANYKALFRDFNAVLPGIQKQRKKSNPSYLRA
jgi:hypothetical protein